MLSLTYLSTATEPFTQDQLTALLEGCRQRNKPAGITGMMLYAGGHFIQTLEGPEQEVNDTFARISNDTRHRQVLVALREETPTRNFPDWSMGFQTISIEEASELPGFSDYLEHRNLPPTDAHQYGRPGIFHRIFRDEMR